MTKGEFVDQRPNFFIIGAPKCGTSTVYHWLKSQPDVFLPHNAEAYWRYKEPYHFCPDLVGAPFRVEADEYALMYQNSGQALLSGEATTLYLFSEVAPKAIYEANPAAKIIICLRHPADFIVSFWRHCLYWGQDEETDFAAAIALTRDLSALPAKARFPKCMQYRKVAHFSKYIARFQEIFPSEQIHFVWTDELRIDPKRALHDILAFLGAPSPAADFDYRAHNVSPGVRSTVLFERALEWQLKRLPLGKEVFGAIEAGLNKVLPDITTRISAKDLAALRAKYDPEYQRLRQISGRA